MNWLSLGAVIVALIGLGAGAFMAARSPQFIAGLTYIVIKAILPSFKNRPKTPKEWEDWRKLSTMSESSMTPAEKDRFKELKKLNAEFRKNG